MPRKLKITLWVAIGLLAATFALIVWGRGLFGFGLFNLLMTIFGLIFACGVLIVYWIRGFWIKRVIKERNLKRYLLMAGASAMGIFFFSAIAYALQLEEGGMVVVTIVCTIALVVGAVLALRFKSTPAS
jgi:amino acid transporter